jgi:hypothetical protein
LEIGILVTTSKYRGIFLRDIVIHDSKFHHLLKQSSKKCEFLKTKFLKDSSPNITAKHQKKEFSRTRQKM